MAQRSKRSISLPADLAAAIERAAGASGTTFSGWIASVADHRLRLEAGLQALTEWELDQGELTAAERDEGRRRARHVLGQVPEQELPGRAAS